jgi:hypothetical protein
MLSYLIFIPDKPYISLSHELVLFPVNSVVNFNCVVWSPKPVDVKWFFKTCDLRKPGDCDGETNFKQVVSKYACLSTVCFLEFDTLSVNQL